MNSSLTTRRVALVAWLFAAATACEISRADTVVNAAGPGAAAASAVAPAPRVEAPPPPPRTALGDQPLRTSAPAVSRGGDATLAAASKPNSMDYPRVAGALGAVIALIFVLRWCGKFFFPTAMGRGQSRAVEVLSRSVLAPKQQVLLLRVGRRLVVVGDSGAQMNTLCEISDPDEVAGLVGQLRDEKVATATAFGSLFGRFNRRFEAGEDADGEPTAPAVAALEDAPEETPVSSARTELDGLRERVRMLSEQFK